MLDIGCGTPKAVEICRLRTTALAGLLSMTGVPLPIIMLTPPSRRYLGCNSSNTRWSSISAVCPRNWSHFSFVCFCLEINRKLAPAPSV